MVQPVNEFTWPHCVVRVGARIVLPAHSASFRPREVSSRTTLMTWIFLSRHRFADPAFC